MPHHHQTPATGSQTQNRMPQRTPPTLTRNAQYAPAQAALLKRYQTMPSSEV